MKNIRFVLYLLKLKSKHRNISFLAISELSHNKIHVFHAHINMRTLTNISWLLVFSSKRTSPFLPIKTGSFVASVNMIKIGKRKFLFGGIRFQFYFLLGGHCPPRPPLSYGPVSFSIFLNIFFISKRGRLIVQCL